MNKEGVKMKKITSLSEILDAKVFPPRTAATTQIACPLIN